MSTTDTFAPYIGGELEIQNQVERYILRGPIERVTVEDGILKVLFKWLAKNDGGPIGSGLAPSPEWTSQDDLVYELSLVMSTGSDIGDGRLSLSSTISGEFMVFFPPSGSKLDPAKVKGLTLPEPAKAAYTLPEEFQRQITAAWGNERKIGKIAIDEITNNGSEMGLGDAQIEAAYWTGVLAAKSDSPDTFLELFLNLALAGVEK